MVNVTCSPSEGLSWTTIETDKTVGYNSGNIVSILAGMALVWAITPGIGLFYSNLPGRNYTLSMIFVSTITLVMVYSQWPFRGHSLASGSETSPYIGIKLKLASSLTQPSVEGTRSASVIYQWMFACTTATLAAGVIAGRRLGLVLIFTSACIIVWPEIAPFIVITVFPLLSLRLVHHWTKLSDHQLPYPPGPKPLPLIGNALDIPSEGWWLTFDQWFKQYGDIISVNLMGQRAVILGSAKLVDELLGERSGTYSDRFTSQMMTEVIDMTWSMAHMRYGENWKNHRRIFQQYFSQSKIRNYYSVHEKHTRLLLRRLLHAPDQFTGYIRRALTNSILDAIYGIEVHRDDDPYLTNVEEAVEGICKWNSSFYVEIFPWLRHMPHWFPGAGFNKKAKVWNKTIQSMREVPYKAVREKMACNNAKRCVVVDMLGDVVETAADFKEIETLIKNSTGIAYTGGVDTTLSATHTFLLAMASYPEAQAKAHAEIDAIVGRDRLPSFQDRPNLPYVNAVLKEVLRWQNVAPISAPHAVSEDDVYQGYLIPKGTMVIGCTWTIAHNPEMYPQPYEFIPDRFIRNGQLNSDVQDPLTFAFGYGRRICPGRYFSLDMLYSIVVNLLASYIIQAPLDKDGNQVKLSREMTTSTLVAVPKQFEVIIQPRHKDVETLIEGAAAEVM